MGKYFQFCRWSPGTVMEGSVRYQLSLPATGPHPISKAAEEGSQAAFLFAAPISP